MFTHAFDAEGLGIGAAGDDEFVVGDLDDVSLGFRFLCRGHGLLLPLCRGRPGQGRGNDRLGCGFFCNIGLDIHDFAVEVHVVCPTLVEPDLPAQATDRLENSAELERSH